TPSSRGSTSSAASLGAARTYSPPFTPGPPDVPSEVTHRHVAKDSIVLEVELTGTQLGAWRGLPATGRRVDFPLCAVYTFDGQDRLAGERIYYDRTTLLRQLGVVSEPTSLKGRLGALLLHPVTVIPALLGIRRKADGAASAQH